jgi:transcriptional regulator with XRE-family HTH domain
MLQRLGRAAREAREAAGRTQLDIATAAKSNHASISRFERGEAWPRNIGRVIVAYEDECGLGRDELWRRAVGA